MTSAPSAPLQGKRIAFLATDGVEEVEYTQPRSAAEQAGARVDLVAPQPGSIQAMRQDLDKGARLDVERTLDQANPADYDALVLPGGAVNPDRLRVNPQAVAFALTFFMQAKPVAAICHGPWTLVEADVVDGRTLTSYPSLSTDIVNAGGIWVDAEVSVDSGLVTSRSPADLPAFCVRMVEEVAEGRHVGQLLSV
jgi:protease I